MTKNTKKKAVHRAIDLAGSQSALARLLGNKHQTISVWSKNGKVPAYMVIQVEKALKKKITRHELLEDHL